MVFNSYIFLIFFPVVVLIHFLLPKRVQYLWLLAASYYFYMNWDARYVLLLLFSTAVTYLSGIAMEKVCGSCQFCVECRCIVFLQIFQFCSGFSELCIDAYRTCRSQT